MSGYAGAEPIVATDEKESGRSLTGKHREDVITVKKCVIWRLPNVMTLGGCYAPYFYGRWSGKVL